MSGESILILETDRALERQLNDVLAAAGYEVYAADTVVSVLQALETTGFPMVVVDARAPYLDPSSFAQQVQALQPDCTVLFTGVGCTTGEAVSMLRGGAADFIAKPFEPTFLLERVEDALECRRMSRARIKLWERRARAAEHALGESRSGSGVSHTRLMEVAEFADFALERFLAIERQNMELERDLRRLENPESETERASLVTWVAHSDTEFANGVMSLGPRLGLDVRPPMHTGGEILDKVSSNPPNIIILDFSLPDIPTPLVVETVKSEYTDIQLVTVDGWGTATRTITVTGGSAQDVTQGMETVDDLIKILEVAAARARDTVMGRDFAAEFKNRHDDFLRRYAQVRKAVEAAAND
ncbi:MAG: DNA-binding NtrC family response regulator [Bradymonadia bacterium]|jgi:DNA-binding NtrC family response regulator